MGCCAFVDDYTTIQFVSGLKQDAKHKDKHTSSSLKQEH